MGLLRRAFCRVLLCCGLLFPVHEAAAQTPAPTPEPFTFGVELDVVSVTAVVYDKAGRFIRGLDKTDIQVFEDGVEQQVTYFREARGGDEKIPLSVVLVLDSSGSMEHNLRFLQEAALSFVYKLEDVDQALVVQFNSSIKGSADFSGDLDRLERFVDGMQAWGGTSLHDAIHYALNRIRDQPGRKALVVFSDGADTTSELMEQDVIDYARAVEATVYGIGIKAGPGFRGGSPRGFLKKIAQETGGEAFFPGQVGELIKIFAAISDELHNHYALAYQPARAADGSYREIEVKLKRSDAEIRVRKGYFALERPPRAATP
jgi:Ca-activated chloride channel family protein